MTRITNALLNSLGDAEDIIRDLVEHEDGGCHSEYHGYCQAHGWYKTDPACPVKRGRELLGLDR